MLAVATAPRSTASVAPSEANFLTDSGVAATRRSPASVSLRTAIFTPRGSPSVADDEDDDQTGDETDDRAPFHQAGKPLVAVPVRPDRAFDLVGCHETSFGPCSKASL